MNKKIGFFIFFCLMSIYAIGQNNWRVGITLGAQANSAILPDLELNTISDVINGNGVVKGIPQYAEITLNYRAGIFMSYKDRVGFTKLELIYSTARIYKQLNINTAFLGDYDINIIDRSYTYANTAISYNIYLNSSHNFYLGLGGSYALLTSYTKNEEPEKNNYNAFINIGIKISNTIDLNLKPEIGINEVYNDSYIHHIMLPFSISIALN